MIQLHVHVTPHQVDELALRDATVVAVDVLRAGTTVITALANEAREVIPTSTVEVAARISGNLAGSVTLLSGERNGKIIEGFHLGNSPAEFTVERVRGKSIVFSSTNGSPLFLKAKYAREMAVCGFVNISAVVSFLKKHSGDAHILCAGNGGGFCMEDAVCAGMLIHLLGEDGVVELGLDDAGMAALLLYKAAAKNLAGMVRKTAAGRYLGSIGFGEDVKLCSAVDTVPVLPVLDGTVLRLRRETEHKD
jgi:2-phosphosulfolactate phosphatase